MFSTFVPGPLPTSVVDRGIPASYLESWKSQDYLPEWIGMAMIGTNHVSRKDTILVPSCGDLLLKNFVWDAHGCCTHLIDSLPCVEVTMRADAPKFSYIPTTSVLGRLPVRA